MEIWRGFVRIFRRGEESKERPDYPTSLDVIEWEGNRYQVAGSLQTNDPGSDGFLLRQLNGSGNIVKVKGGIFRRYQITKDPGEGDVYRRDEGVRNTGQIVGGSKEED